MPRKMREIQVFARKNGKFIQKASIIVPQYKILRRQHMMPQDGKFNPRLQAERFFTPKKAKDRFMPDTL